MTTRRIGANVQQKPPDADDLWKTQLPCALLLNPDPGVAQRIKELSPATVIVMRAVGGDNNFVQNPAINLKQNARQFADTALPIFARSRKWSDNIVLTYNEMQIGDLRDTPLPTLVDRAKRYAEGEWEVLKTLKAEGYQTVGFNFSRGTHQVMAIDHWSPYEYYAPVMADSAMDFMGYHAYWPLNEAKAGIASILSNNATTFRYREIFNDLPPAARKPIMLTEFGEDGPGGYKTCGSSISNYIAKMQAVEAVWDAAPHFADKYIYLAFMYLAGHFDPHWDSFDPMDIESERAAFLAFARRPGAKAQLPAGIFAPPPVTVPPHAVVPPSDKELLLAAMQNEQEAMGIPWSPNFALQSAANDMHWGIALSQEIKLVIRGVTYIYQAYPKGIAIVEEGKWGEVKLLAY